MTFPFLLARNKVRWRRCSGRSQVTETSGPGYSDGKGGSGFELMMARRPALSHEALPLEVLIRTFLMLPSRLITKDTAACNVVELRTPGSIDSRSQLGST